MMHRNPAEEAEQQRRDEEHKAWQKQVAKYHQEYGQHNNLALAEWIRIDKRTPDDPGYDPAADVGMLRDPNERTQLGDGLYRRNPPYKIKHWWTDNDEHPIQIKVKDGVVWGSPLVPFGNLKGVHMDALKELNKAKMDFCRGEGASTILLTMNRNPHGHAPHMEFPVDMDHKIEELEAIIADAGKKQVGIEFNDVMQEFFNEHVSMGMMKVEKREWFYNMRDQLAVNPEGKIRAMEFEKILTSAYADTADVQGRVSQLQNATEADRANLRNQMYSRFTDAAIPLDQRLDVMNSEFAQLDDKLKKLEANQKKVETHLNKFIVASKTTDPKVIDFERIERKREESREARDKLLIAMLAAKQDMANQVLAMRETLEADSKRLNENREQIRVDREALAKEKAQLNAALLPNDPQRQNLAKREGELGEREAKVSENEKKIADQTAKLAKITEKLDKQGDVLTKTDNKAKELGQDIQKRKDETEALLARTRKKP